MMARAERIEEDDIARNRWRFGVSSLWRKKLPIRIQKSIGLKGRVLEIHWNETNEIRKSIEFKGWVLKVHQNAKNEIWKYIGFKGWVREVHHNVPNGIKKSIRFKRWVPEVNQNVTNEIRKSIEFSRASRSQSKHKKMRFGSPSDSQRV